MRDARTAAAVNHENLITIHAVEVHPLPYLVMELIEEGSLQSKIESDGPLSIAEIVRIGRQLGDGLGAAHAVGLVHRDIKAANILLKGDNQRAIITDFGLARSEHDAPITDTLHVAGTPQYMSPEQALGQPVDVRSDLFSLGSVLFAMCAGRSPFQASTPVATILRVCDDYPPSLRQIRPEIPDFLEILIGRLLNKSPHDRPQSAQDVSRLLPDPTSATKSFDRPKSSLAFGGHSPKVLRLAAVFLTIVCGAWVAYRNANWFQLPSASTNFTAAGDNAPKQRLDERSTPRVEVAESPSAVPTRDDPPAAAVAPFNAAQAESYQAAWSRYLGVPVELKNAIGLTLRLIPPGEFEMGAPQEDIDRLVSVVANDTLRVELLTTEVQHRVRLTNAFYLGTFEVTQDQYQSIMGQNPSHFSQNGSGADLVQGLQTGKHPVEMVTWNNAATICHRLSDREGLVSPYLWSGNKIVVEVGNGYRLPTEAEWEFACRAGSVTPFWCGANSNDPGSTNRNKGPAFICDMAWTCTG